MRTAKKVSSADQGREGGIGSRKWWVAGKCAESAFDGVGNTKGGIDDDERRDVVVPIAKTMRRTSFECEMRQIVGVPVRTFPSYRCQERPLIPQLSFHNSHQVIFGCNVVY